MQHKSSFLFISTVLLVLLARECQSELMCYVCDHCSSITPGTQLEACDETFFSSGGTELPSTMTTTEASTEQDTTMPATTEATMMTTQNSTKTTEAGTESTTEMKDSTMAAESTQPPVPTPPTVGQAETTTALPTPPLLGTVQPIMGQVSTTTMAMEVDGHHNESMADDSTVMTNMNSTTDRNYMNSSTFRVRQTRHVRAAEDAQGMSFHCYTVQIESNNTVNTQRGCARVTTEESVCGQLKQIANNETMVKKCEYCTMNRCNGSSALGISMITMVLGLVAALLKHG